METQTIETPTSSIDIKVSKKYSLDWRDLGKGLVIAALSPVVPIIQQSIAAGNFVFDWKAMLAAAVGGLLIYLTKNFFTATATVITETEK